MSVHPTIAGFSRQGRHLLAGGVSVERLAERSGRTPFFAYDRAMIDRRVSALRLALPADVHLHYAIKANPMPALVQHLAGLVDGFDVASAFEMKTALDTPMPAARVSFAGPGKRTEELAQAVAAGVAIEMESAGEAHRIVETGNRLGIRPRVAIRVNPDFQLKGSGMRMGGGPQQFGIDAEEVPDLLDRLASFDIEFLGFHIFAGSQNLQAANICQALERNVALMLRLAENAPWPLSYINLGGGFGIPYFDKDQPLDLCPIGEALGELMESRVRPLSQDIRVVIELGRYLVGEAGIYVTRIIDVKQSRGKKYLVTDGGLHHQLAASGNFGQVIRRNFPLAVANRMTENDVEQVTVVGCLCTPLDVLGDNVLLPCAAIGDLVAVFQAGAYGLSASPTAFLGHPAPMEMLV